ncbi:hypothetical protein BCR35DRAFT_332725 [Leucosporidium creatinivorum]|uniref:Uncharacterized protein n=1 Tax=Leucosporidium creatinivorum TaxID=106004 RepID=A0A1Y2F0N1_9BASI|nr:hypothetical protein BCR35DRAFT_332725 [Leucosporidium creatinivorum]
MPNSPTPPSAAEIAIEHSRYASKSIYSLLPPSPSYSADRTSFLQGLQVAAGFFKWAHARLLSHRDLLYLREEIEHAITELVRLHKGLGEGREPSPRETEELGKVYQGAIRRVLPLELCKELLAADFAEVYHQLQSATSVEGIRVLSMAIVIKTFYAGWHNLTGWQQLSAFYTAKFYVKEELALQQSHSLGHTQRLQPRARRSGQRRAVWRSELEGRWA